MKEERATRHVIDLLFVLALFALFAFSGIALIVLGAGVYQRNVSRMEENYALRTSGAYLSEKVRRADAAKGMELGEIDGIDALLLREEVNDISYTTYLYLYDGSLTELFARSDIALPASAGTPILALKDLSFSIEEDGLLRVTLTETDSRVHTLYLAPHGSGEVTDE